MRDFVGCLGPRDPLDLDTRARCRWGRRVWISYVRADMRKLKISWSPDIRRCVSRIYELYRIELKSTHSLEHVYEVFHTGVCLWASLNDSFFWNLKEQCRLTYALALLTHDLSLSRWSVRDLASLAHERTLYLCYDYNLYSEIDEPLLVHLFDGFSLNEFDSFPTKCDVVNPFLMMRTLLKLADHSHLLRPWSIHREWVGSLIEARVGGSNNQLLALTHRYYERNLRPHLLTLIVWAPKMGQELYHRYSANMERWQHILV